MVNLGTILDVVKRANKNIFFYKNSNIFNVKMNGKHV